MSSVGFQTVAVLLVLLPGFVAAGLIHALCVRPTQTEFDKLIEALIYSFVVYVTFVMAFHRFPLQSIRTTQAGSTTYYLSRIHPSDLVVLFAIGIALGLFLSASITNDFHGKVFRALRITERTSRPSIWQDVFSEMNYYVQVQFQDGRSLIGYPRYFSDSPEQSSLFLEKAAWISEDGAVIDILGPGILVTKEMPIETIMFLKADPRPPKGPENLSDPHGSKS
ncbi:MAG: DUF6338 family protein [Candidatus Acidiferrales bacterium]